MPTLAFTLLICAPFFLGLNWPMAWSLWALVLGIALWRAHGVAGEPAHRYALPVPTSQRVMLGATVAFAFLLPAMQLAGGTCTAVPSTAPCVTSAEQSWLSLVCALMLALWFALVSGPSRPSVTQVLAALTVAGTVHAVYGLLTFFLGATPLFLDGVFHHKDVPTGGFPNRNHFAAFLYLAIFAGIALVLRLPADTGTGRAGRWRMLLDQRIIWRLAIMLMVLALIATRSRAGNAVFIIGLLAGFAWLMLVERPRRQSRAAGSRTLQWRFVVLVMVSVLALDALLLGSVVGLDKLEQRISDTSFESEQRGAVNAALLAHPELFTPLGHGAGSFVLAFEPVKPRNLQAIYDHAHNDYLQVLVERGWAGALLFAVALLAALWRALGPRGSEKEERRPRSNPEVNFALVASTTALLFHAGVEFVTQVPAIWMAWLAVLALALTGDSHLPRTTRHAKADQEFHAGRRARTTSASARPGR